ncbi:type III secretion system inner rod subunit SctI [Pseudomonas plecoglossicida]|nr:type III secretion system inner rod subunit SctI [Pseudomonas plecoglossicida]EPB94360.1 hypothetical protein L321_18482 [Pseudomonas plecoglossicida NB2011]QLB56301.1 type III secretion system inner rod subunit SctI [Pseudomonas plecoglossicida]GLR37913.1 hypothetical protein GCM10011247_33110 [Pseudomonas plecoglossicida]
MPMEVSDRAIIAQEQSMEREIADADSVAEFEALQDSNTHHGLGVDLVNGFNEGVAGFELQEKKISESIAAAADDPMKLLGVQMEFLKLFNTLDLVAKGAGKAVQSIETLTKIQ